MILLSTLLFIAQVPPSPVVPGMGECGDTHWNPVGEVCVTYCGDWTCTLSGVENPDACAANSDNVEGETPSCRPRRIGEPAEPRYCSIGNQSLYCRVEDTPD